MNSAHKAISSVDEAFLAYIVITAVGVRIYFLIKQMFRPPKTNSKSAAL